MFIGVVFIFTFVLLVHLSDLDKKASGFSVHSSRLFRHVRRVPDDLSETNLTQRPQYVVKVRNIL